MTDVAGVSDSKSVALEAAPAAAATGVDSHAAASFQASTSTPGTPTGVQKPPLPPPLDDGAALELCQPCLDRDPASPSCIDPALAEACAWPGFYSEICESKCDELGLPHTDTMEFVKNQCCGLTGSSSFTGIASPETSADIMHTSWGIDCMLHVAAIESDAACREELLVKPHGPECLFGDILTFFVGPLLLVVRTLIAAGNRNLLEILTPAIKSRKASHRVAHCFRHDKPCTIMDSDFETAGSPCQDFSSRGSPGSPPTHTLQGTAGRIGPGGQSGVRRVIGDR